MKAGGGRCLPRFCVLGGDKLGAQHVGNLLEEARKNIETKLNREFSQNDNDAQAALLENFLMALKIKILQNKNTIQINENNIGDAIQEILKDKILSDMLNMLSKVKGINKIFYKEYTSKNSQHNFEEVYALIQSKIAKVYGNKKKVSSNTFATGQQTTRINLGDGTVTSNPPGQNLIKEFYQYLDTLEQSQREQITKMFFGTSTKIGDEQIFNNKPVQQKADSMGNLSFQWESTASTQANTIIEILLTKTFSLKNYYSASMRGAAAALLKLGDTSLFRSIISALLYSGLQPDMALNYYIRGIMALGINHPEECRNKVYDNFVKLRKMYELTGMGQSQVNEEGIFQEGRIVDFLVFNDPSHTGVRVFSSKKIIDEFLNENTKFDQDMKDLTKEITYSASLYEKSIKYWK